MKRFMTCTALCSALASFLTGCAHINSVSLTSIPAQRSNMVKAQVEKTIFLAFNFDNDYIDPLVSDLKRQCPKGLVSGILTKDETISYFIVFKKKVTATGYCSATIAKNDRAKRSSASESSEQPAATQDTEE